MTTNITARARIRVLSRVALSAVLAGCASNVADGDRVAQVAEGLGISDPPIVISQVYGGGGNTSAPFRNDFVELFNRSASTVEINNWSVQYASATGTGSFAANPVTVISATLAPGQYLLVQLASGGAVGAALPSPDANGTVNMSATGGKVALVNASAGLACNGGSTPCSADQEASIVDLVGYDGANYFETAAAPTASATASVTRRNGGCTDSNDNQADFVLATPPTPRNGTTPLAPCGATPPEDAGVDAGTDAGVSPTITAIHTIQGASHVSPLVGTTVTTRGIVTGVRSNGYYLQDPLPDADDATSEAIFVFTSSAPPVAVGDDLIATGPISEFRAGGTSGLANLSNTEINRPNTSTVISHGNALPAPVVIGLGGRVPPNSVIENDSGSDVEVANSFDPSEDGIDFYESLEAMRVQVNDALAVGPSKLFGATSKEIYIVPDAGSGAGLRTARGGVVVRASDFNPERIVLTNTILPALPDADVGDSFPGAIVGVIDYEFSNYRVIPTSAVPPISHNGLARETLSLPPLGAADLRVAAFNVENLDPLDPPEKFAELASIIVDQLDAPDILTVEEIQDNDGATNSGTVDASLTFNTLIAAISAASGPSYQFRSVDPVDGQDGGEPGGNIRVGFLFRSDRGLAFVDRPGAGSLTANDVHAIAGAPQLDFSPGRIDPSNSAFTNSRKPLAAQLTFRGVDLFLIGNHFNSKGDDQPLFGRFQPPTLGSEVQRLAQAHVVADFVARILAIDPDANVVALGDLNDFEFSAPVNVLKAAGLTTLIETLPPAERYTYVFEGNSQVLDHVLVSPHALGRVAGFDVLHVNAEFASQASDHDPGVATLALDAVASHQLTSSGPATMFLGLVNGDDQGTQFDLAVELTLNGSVVARAEQRCISGVTRNANTAKQLTLPFPAFTPVNVAAGNALALRISTRIGTTATGAKCSGPGGSHGNADGLRLYFDGASRPARADAVSITPAAATTLYLHASGNSRFLSSTAPTAASPKTLDSRELKFNGGNPWREIGTFSANVP